VVDHAAYVKTQPQLYKEMMVFSKLPPSEAKLHLSNLLNNRTAKGKKHFKSSDIKHFQCLNDISPFEENNFHRSNYTDLDKPTFRGFVLGIVASLLYCNGEPDCLWDQEKHYRTQTNKCTPCAAKYDIIVKVNE